MYPEEEGFMLAVCHASRSKLFTLFVVLLIILTSVLYRGAHAYGQQADGAPISHAIHADRPVLAFYYAWYQRTDWCLCHMSDLPTIRYNSTDDATIERQINWAAHAGITGFINSWWGPGDKTDHNFAKLLTHAASLQKRTGYPFASTLYIESDAPALQSHASMVQGLRYIASHYSNNPHFLHWHGKPVLFFWDPLGNGRTLALWASIRRQVDPHDKWLWSAEGVDTSLLTVFDGIHLFSAGYWGLLHGNMAAVDKGFRSKVNTYNAAHHSHKIWAAGVMPGYDDTRVPGRVGAYKVPRNNGSTYRTSWNAAIASSPEWITITTFNEWFEGAMIEPSVTYGARYLTITRQESKQWHG
jgi:Glycosyl hydrolase family 99